MLPLTSFSVSERESFFSRMRVFLLYKSLESINLLGGNARDVWHDVLDAVGDDFGSF